MDIICLGDVREWKRLSFVCFGCLGDVLDFFPMCFSMYLRQVNVLGNESILCRINKLSRLDITSKSRYNCISLKFVY